MSSLKSSNQQADVQQPVVWAPVPVRNARLHQPITVAEMGILAEANLGKVAGLAMTWTMSGLLVENKGQRMLIPHAAVMFALLA